MYKKPKFGQVPELAQLYFDTFSYTADGYFVDIGAFDCEQWSNTLTLAKAGWSGIMVEPQPELAAKCKFLLSQFPKVSLVEGAVSDYEGTGYLRLAGSLSTIEEDQIDLYRKTEEFAHYFAGDGDYADVKVTTLDVLLRENQVPFDFEVLSIDVEGSELAVLKGFSIDVYQPKLVIVEVHEGWHPELDFNATQINDYFEQAGYEKIYSDHINNIYR